jgi:hypothetical protein
VKPLACLLTLKLLKNPVENPLPRHYITYRFSTWSIDNMSAIIVTSVDIDLPALQRATLDEIEDVAMLETEVVVKDGIAAVLPTYHDFKEWERLGDDDWLMLPHMAEAASRVLGSLDECNHPDLDARWTLNQALRRIREGADALERHIARNGMWLSEEEWWECDSYMKALLWPDDPRKNKAE